MTQKREYNYNIALFRAVLCFGVVCAHFWREDKPGIVFTAISCCVPLFFLISFFFFQRHFRSDDAGQIKNRFVRLIVPQVGWAVIYFIVINLARFALEQGNFLSLKDLVGQIISGHCYNESMWFQTDLIIITALFYVSGALFKRTSTALSALLLLALFAFAFQYSNLNYRIFSVLPHCLSFPMGRLAEMLPYASFGIFLSYFNGNAKWSACLVAAGLVGVVALTVLETASPNGFYYQGVKLFSRAFFAACVVSFIPPVKLKGIPLSIVEFITRYTLGIYCMHRLMASILTKILHCIGYESLSSTICFCILVYVLCFLTFLLIDRFVSNKFVRMLYR